MTARAHKDILQRRNSIHQIAGELLAVDVVDGLYEALAACYAPADLVDIVTDGQAEMCEAQRADGADYLRLTDEYIAVSISDRGA